MTLRTQRVHRLLYSRETLHKHLSGGSIIATLGGKGRATTSCGDLVSFSVNQCSASFVYFKLGGGGNGHLQCLRDDVDFAGGVLEFRDVFRVVLEMNQPSFILSGEMRLYSRI